MATDKNAGHLAVYRTANLGEDLLLSIVGMKLSPLRKGEIYSGPLSPATCFVRSSGTESIESSSDSKAFDGQAWQRGVGVTLASL